MCEKKAGWKRGEGAVGWEIKEKLIWALQRFSVFSAALSSSERPCGGWSVWVWSAGSTGHCVGRSSASASPDCPWFVPFPAHSYVIICDKLLCSQATNPHVRGLAYRTTLRKPHAHTRPWRGMKTHILARAQMCILTHLLTLGFTQTKLWAVVTSGFCFLEPKDGGYNPGFQIDTQQSSAHFTGSCCAQHCRL